MTEHADRLNDFQPMPRPPSLVEVVVKDLRERIVFGYLKPGDRISDARVASAMDISRAPVREALAHLAARGLIDEVPGRGSFVAKLTTDDVINIFDCRRAIEGTAALRVAEMPDVDRRVAQLKSVVDDMLCIQGLAEDKLSIEHAKNDHRFHTTLCELTENTWLVRLYTQLADQSLMMQALDSAAHRPASGAEFVALHMPIVDAIATGDPDTACGAIVAHIDLSERLFLEETFSPSSHQ